MKKVSNIMCNWLEKKITIAFVDVVAIVIAIILSLILGASLIALKSKTVYW